MQRDVRERRERVAQRLLEPTVKLDDMQVRSPRGETLGQHPHPPTDLEHHVLWLHPGNPLDHVEDVAIDEKVLAELTLT